MTELFTAIGSFAVAEYGSEVVVAIVIGAIALTVALRRRFAATR